MVQWSSGQIGGYLARRVERAKHIHAEFLLKICLGLWEKLCRFVGKITLVCGKNSVNKVKCWIIPVSLWEKFGEQKYSVG